MRAFAILAALVAIPLALLVLLRLAITEQLDRLATPPEPIVVTAEAVELRDERTARADLTWTDPTVLVAPRWEGLVTDVHLEPGDVVTTGRSVVSIDGVGRIAATTPRPFWRVLRVGDRGPDVAAAEQLLADLRFHNGPIDDIYDPAVARAAARWAASLGQRSPDGSFDPSLVVWLPLPSLTVVAVDIASGLPAPPPGTVIARGPKLLGGAVLLDANDRPIVLDDPSAWEFVYDGRGYALTEGRPTSLRPDLLANLADDLAEDTTSIEGVLRRVEPVVSILVPASAVMVNAGGDFCVWVPTRDGFAARRVEVGQGTVNRAQILSGLAAGEPVLANPGTSLVAPACP